MLENTNNEYNGQAFERGGTSIRGRGVTPAVKWLVKHNHIIPGMRVLDYGAGRWGRNGDFLKSIGCKVYAYDPYHGTDVDGWDGVSNQLPETTFDVAFTSFVLNVVPVREEEHIILTNDRYAPVSFHITRNQDIRKMVLGALSRGDHTVTQFIRREYPDSDLVARLDSGRITTRDITDVCSFGVQTVKGFQRIPDLSRYDTDLIRRVSGFKIYRRES